MARLVITTNIEVAGEARLVTVETLQKNLVNAMELALEEAGQVGEVDARLELGH